MRMLEGAFLPSVPASGALESSLATKCSQYFALVR